LKIVLITGAGSGFGQRTAFILAKSGFHVIATLRNLQSKKEFEREIRENRLDKNIDIFQMDITKEEEVLLVKEQVEKRYGSIDILINNAGYAQGGFFEEIRMEDWRKQFDTNLFGHIFVTKTFLPLLKKKEGGKIINISSISGFLGFPGLGPYVASKHALEGWSESLRLELLEEGISVSLVEPGSYKTGIWEKGFERIPTHERSNYQKNILERARNSSRTGGDPNEVANLIVKICKKRYPKLRYPIGKGVRFIYMVKTIIPFRFIERFFGKFMLK